MVLPPSRQASATLTSVMGYKTRLPADICSSGQDSCGVVAPVKKKPVAHQRTLDMEHMRIMQRFEHKEAELSTMRRDLEALKRDVEALEAIGRANLSDRDFDRLMSSRDDITDLTSRIRQYTTDSNEVTYLMTTGDILFKYYDVVENGTTCQQQMAAAASLKTAKNTKTSDSTSSKRGVTTNVHANANVDANANSILRYFCTNVNNAASSSASAPAPPSVCATSSSPPHPSSSSSSHPSGGTNVSNEARDKGGGNGSASCSGDDRATLLDKYMSCIDNNYMKGGNCPQPTSELAEKCPHCGSEHRVVLLHDGCVYCNDCFTQEYILIDHEKPSYKDPPKEIIYYAYKRINHFNEWLNQIQGKETTEIPDDVYDRILLEIKKEKITNMAVLNKEKVKVILKKLRINKYYEHVAHIIFRLNGVPVPHMSPELEETLRQMFFQIQVPFLRHAPTERKNFLSYSYVLHKFMQLLEKDEYLPSFPLLKSRDKLHQQDVIWQKICYDLGWAFYKSI